MTTTTTVTMMGMMKFGASRRKNPLLLWPWKNHSSEWCYYYTTTSSTSNVLFYNNNNNNSNNSSMMLGDINDDSMTAKTAGDDHHPITHLQTKTPIAIVGGGPTGLFMAHLLQLYNVPFCLIESKTTEERFQHPQAHFLNTRTMEILKHTHHHSSSSCSGDNSNDVNNDDGIGTGGGLYDKIRASMPPVDEWKSFRFGPTMTASDSDGLMATVIHPVDVPLRANADANGKLVVNNNDDIDIDAVNEDSSSFSSSNNHTNRFPLSEVSVGHLAQHTFCRILYETVQQKQQQEQQKIQDNPNNNLILYGHTVTDASFDDLSRQWTIHTDNDTNGRTIQCPIIVAADGARSFIRTHVLGEQHDEMIRMLGQEKIQNLMNIHFQIPSLDVDDKKIPPAMLYTVFHSKVLAMVVRHGPGDYVMQIPYFAPYQTPDEDFTYEKVYDMVQAALGDDTINFKIRSIRPWTMGSLVAERYYSNKGVFLVGDAAHIFPPAGGLGMNTGLQDVFSLAWRLAVVVKKFSSDETSRSLPSIPKDSIEKVGYIYERHRQPIAQQNAALSVRNYNRVLGVMQSCYLNHEHPSALVAALDSASGFVPMHIRQQTFRSLLRTALFPLSQLHRSPNSLFSRHVKANLSKLLQSGQGLPLLFPRHELDFKYNPSSEVDHDTDWIQDSVSSSPRLILGGLFPHLQVRVSSTAFDRFPRLQPVEPGKISTRDLPAQLATDENPIVFCVVDLVRQSQTTIEMDVDHRLNRAIETLQNHWTEFNIPVVPCRLIMGGNLQRESQSSGDGSGILTMFADGHDLDMMTRDSETGGEELVVVIGPEGHIGAVLREDK
jgi:2-polyprenyl-6-methoxyphenol hydroxylase-like FAD-dependent oxidoreductase